MTAAPGIYIHVPFCAAKCPYCDFYSLPADGETMNAYCNAVCAVLDGMAPVWPQRAPAPPVGAAAPAATCSGAALPEAMAPDTLYFGGGTPSLLGAKRLAKLIGRARECFGLFDAEITVELNPGGDGLLGGDGSFDEGGTFCESKGFGGNNEPSGSGRPGGQKEPASLAEFLREVHAAGANRLSMGLQSAVPAELAILGRRHTPEDAAHAVELARAAGFTNISLDLMLGVPGQTMETVAYSVRFCAGLGVEHISAYLLKIEPGTPFERQCIHALCPDDDAQAELYLCAVETLEALGYRQYEISNFARPGCESRHNLKYWDCREYLGVGPAAHSLTGGVRWYWPRDLRGFLRNWRGIVLEEGDIPAQLLPEAESALPTLEDAQRDVQGVCLQEYAMLRLRLTQGLCSDEALVRYPGAAAELDAMFRRAEPLRQAGLLCPGGEAAPLAGALALTPRGFLLSNAVTLRLLG